MQLTQPGSLKQINLCPKRFFNPKKKLLILKQKKLIFMSTWKNQSLGLPKITNSSNEKTIFYHYQKKVPKQNLSYTFAKKLNYFISDILEIIFSFPYVIIFFLYWASFYFSSSMKFLCHWPHIVTFFFFFSKKNLILFTCVFL